MKSKRKVDGVLLQYLKPLAAAMKPSRNGVEGDSNQHYSNCDGLDTPKFLPDTDKGPSDHAPKRVVYTERPRRTGKTLHQERPQ